MPDRALSCPLVLCPLFFCMLRVIMVLESNLAMMQYVEGNIREVTAPLYARLWVWSPSSPCGSTLRTMHGRPSSP